MVIKNNFTNGYWRTVPITDAIIIGYIGRDPDDPGGGYRLVLGSGDNQTSTIRFDNGILRVWGRVGRHFGDTLAMQANIGIEELDLNPLIHAFDANAHDMPGRLNGTATLLYTSRPPPMKQMQYPYPSQAPPPGTRPTTTTAPTSAPAPEPAMPEAERLLLPLYGEAEIKLSRSNLANYGPIAFLYNLMNAGPGLDAPNGTGDVKIHLERGALRVDRLRYFNRGVEVRATATTTQIWNLPDNPITGIAVGTLQPLRNRKLPLLADINDILAAIQSDLTTIAIEGNARKPVPRPMFFGDVGGEFQRFIVGDVRSELGTGGTGGE
jgi:hypothetical protein